MLYLIHRKCLSVLRNLNDLVTQSYLGTCVDRAGRRSENPFAAQPLELEATITLSWRSSPYLHFATSLLAIDSISKFKEPVSKIAEQTAHKQHISIISHYLTFADADSIIIGLIRYAMSFSNLLLCSESATGFSMTQHTICSGLFPGALWRGFCRPQDSSQGLRKRSYFCFGSQSCLSGFNGEINKKSKFIVMAYDLFEFWTVEPPFLL